MEEDAGQGIVERRTSNIEHPTPDTRDPELPVLGSGSQVPGWFFIRVHPRFHPLRGFMFFWRAAEK